MTCRGCGGSYYIILVYSCIALAVPFALIPSNSTSFELVYLWVKSAPSRLFVHPSILHQALQAAEELKFPLERIYLLGIDTLKCASGCPDLASLIHNVRRKNLLRHVIVQMRQDTLAYLVFLKRDGRSAKRYGYFGGALVYFCSSCQGASCSDKTR